MFSYEKFGEVVPRVITKHKNSSRKTSYLKFLPFIFLTQILIFFFSSKIQHSRLSKLMSKFNFTTNHSLMQVKTLYPTFFFNSEYVSIFLCRQIWCIPSVSGGRIEKYKKRKHFLN